MTQNIPLIYEAHQQNLKALQLFLSENKLRPSIVINENSVYYYIQNNDQIIGTIGAELNQYYALIRAAGIAQDWRRKGVANKLFDKLITELEKRGVVQLYLFSRQAKEFWTKMGFQQCTIQEIIDVLSNTPQVKEFINDNTIWSDVAWHRPIKLAK